MTLAFATRRRLVGLARWSWVNTPGRLLVFWCSGLAFALTVAVMAFVAPKAVAWAPVAVWLALMPNTLAGLIVNRRRLERLGVGIITPTMYFLAFGLVVAGAIVLTVRP